VTLCVIWRDLLPNASDRLVIACDSLISGGYRYPFGTKLSLFERKDCALAWEGSTSYTYSFAFHAKTDIDWSDQLSHEADIDAICRRMVVIFNEMWSAAMRTKDNMYRDEQFSFLFGGYTERLSRHRAWHITKDEEGVFSARELGLEHPTFVGSGQQAAQAILDRAPETTPYSVLRQVIDDPNSDDVGGVPQAYVITSTDRYPIGTVKDGERYVFGRRVMSSGHRAKIQYVPYGREIPIDVAGS
jgi:hypothetical protein